jgi:5'-nucleotidase
MTKICKQFAIIIGVCISFSLLWLPAIAVVSATAPISQGGFTLTILHVNDTHSHLDPSVISYICRDGRYQVELGGFSRLATVIDGFRRQGTPLLFLHAGDMVQGTLYYAKYQGRADIDLLNALGLDAATLGNHDFDGGEELTAKLAELSAFSIVSANVDVSRTTVLAGRIKPYVVKNIAGERIAIIGATTPAAASISRPGGRIVFHDVVSQVSVAVGELRAMGVNKIILLTHLGYDEDLRLARTVPGIDVIIGGHSHTLLGGQGGNASPFRSAGLQFQPAGDYPTVITGLDGQTVLVAQAWEWGKLLGNLEVTFDSAGTIQAWQGRPVLVGGDILNRERVGQGAGQWSTPTDDDRSCLPPVLSRYEKDPRIEERLAVYAKPLAAFQQEKIATALRDLKRTDPFGPGQMVAESMLWRTRHLNTRVALQNAGGVRCDIPAGDITLKTVHELLPFANTIYVVELTGRQLRRTLEEMIRGYIADGRSSLIYTAGLSFDVNRRASFGKRIRELKVKGDNGYEPVVSEGYYRVAVQNYLAAGGDGCKTLKRAVGFRYDTGFADADVFVEYLREFPHGPAGPIRPAAK